MKSVTSLKDEEELEVWLNRNGGAVEYSSPESYKKEYRTIRRKEL